MLRPRHLPAACTTPTSNPRCWPGPTPAYDPRANRRAAIHVDKDSDPFQTWYIGATNDGFTGSAQVTDGNGNTICLGQGACQAAMHYISKHPHDFTTALDLAANYCIDHPDKCQSYDNNRAISDDLLNLGMALAAGTYTAGDITAADTADGAANAANGVRLNTQLTGEQISGGHAFADHVVKAGEFPASQLGASSLPRSRMW